MTIALDSHSSVERHVRILWCHWKAGSDV